VLLMIVLALNALVTRLTGDREPRIWGGRTLRALRIGAGRLPWTR
jgi:hypothetical protein